MRALALTVALAILVPHGAALAEDGIIVPPEDPVGETDAIEQPEASVRDPYKPRFIGFPVIAYTPDTSVAFAALGLVRFRTASTPPDGRQSSLGVAGSYTLRQQWLVGVEPSLMFDDGRSQVIASFLFQDWPSDYFGIGDGARLADQEEFVPRRIRAWVEARRAVAHPHLHLGLMYRLSWVDVRTVESGGLLDTERVLGVEGGITSGLGLTLTWDDRDNDYAPTGGSWAAARFGGNLAQFGSDHEYVVGSIDARTYQDVGRRWEHVLAARLYVEGNSGDVPFYELGELGGSKLMRGMTSGRYRDNNLWVTQLEYRSPFLWRLGLTGFAALGDVFTRFSGDELDDPKWTAGAGVRLRIDEASRVHVRLDYGVSAEEYTNVYFSIAEAF